MELLRAARKRAQLTQAQLGARLGKHQSFVAKYEGGERRLDLVEFMTIARVLELDWSAAAREIEAEYGQGSGGPIEQKEEAESE